MDVATPINHILMSTSVTDKDVNGGSRRPDWGLQNQGDSAEGSFDPQNLREWYHSITAFALRSLPMKPCCVHVAQSQALPLRQAVMADSADRSRSWVSGCWLEALLRIPYRSSS